ncbi:MAG TPA: hypothetical protein DIV86_06945, partial [Alphaproteobacteria bacterium]|nr:hypothetical protein [Alphaproteobacteria bacterium]
NFKWSKSGLSLMQSLHKTFLPISYSKGKEQAGQQLISVENLISEKHSAQISPCVSENLSPHRHFLGMV